MFCSRCGVPVTEGSKFCQGCGAAIAGDKTHGIEMLKPDYSDPLPPPSKPSVGISDALANSSLARSLLALLACFYGLVIFPAFWGVTFDSKQYGGTLMIVSGSVLAYLWKRRNKSPWSGGAVGVGLAVLAISLSGFVLGVVGKTAF